MKCEGCGEPIYKTGFGYRGAAYSHTDTALNVDHDARPAPPVVKGREEA